MISTIYDEGGDVLKLIGDGTLAMFTAEDRTNACRSALTAARKTIERIGELKRRRATSGLPETDIYLALHIGEVVYGNFGSREQLDFTVVGPAVNEAQPDSRYVSAGRSADIDVVCLSRRARSR